ncbi:MAG: GlsB/YeaQ/YmgE family stress response membrane protein [Nibricoccus sp.]
MNFKAFVTILLIGALAGWLSGVIMKGKGFGLAGNVIVGVIGALLGGFIFSLVGISASGLVGQLIFATAGALLFAYLLRFIKN